MWYIILGAIILVCLAVIYKVGKGKVGRLKTVNIESTEKEKQVEVKKKLLELKLEKKFLNLGRVFLDMFKTATVRIKDSAKGIKIKKKPLGKFRPLKTMGGKKDDKDESVLQGKLLEAQVLFKKGQIDEAESKFIEVLEVEPKNVETYMGLGEIYGMRKDWQTAEEAYRYIIKIKPKVFDGYKKLVELFKLAKKWDEVKKLMEEVLNLGHQEAWVYENLGLGYKKVGYPDKAEAYFRRAVEVEPQNEKLLDYLLEVAIINKNKVLAQKAFNTLSGICRDEIKLQSYRDKIDIL